MYCKRSLEMLRHVHQYEPQTVKKIFTPKTPPKPVPKPPPQCPSSEVKRGPRVNQLDIQMLSSNLYRQVFPSCTPPTVDPHLVTKCRRELLKHSMITKPEDYTPDIDLAIPPLEGSNIEEHFWNIGEQQAGPYRELVVDVLQEIPKAPEEWVLQPGWTRYVQGEPPKSVPYPLEQALVFDVEVCMVAGKAPTLATAVSTKAWYGWVSESLMEGTCKPVTSHQYSLDVLIPLESDSSKPNKKCQEQSRIVIGHNVSYDRARIKEQYWLKPTGTRFLDTMSMHICISGLTSYQRALLKSQSDDLDEESWSDLSSLNSLNDVHSLYCGSAISKETRNLFVDGTLKEIRENFQKVMSYCCGDVQATHNILKKMFPMFLERFPHPVTLAGMLELSIAYLPVNGNWNRYVNSAEQTYADLEIESKMILARRADQACQLLNDERYKQDVWLWDEDWSVKNIKLKKNAPKVAQDDEAEDECDELTKKFRYLEDTQKYLAKVETLLPGYPNWYRKLCTKPGSPDWVPGPHLIGTSMRITPKLLNLTWEGYPLHYIRDKGWGCLIPFTSDLEEHKGLIPLAKLLEKCPVLTGKPSESSPFDTMASINSLVQENLVRKEYYSKVKPEGAYKGSGVWANVEVDGCCYFIKLPHKNGPSHNVGNPLSKDFLSKFSDNVLAGDTESAELVLGIARQLSYWRNNCQRIYDQMIVWVDEDSGAILPQVVVSGTLTRRAVEPTWMTASNAHPERVGSELRSLIQAPPNYAIVGADVDSQELWIASVIGDANHAQMHGATPLGWMTLSGTKKNGTDMHSVTAKAVGISRDHAKVLNYARIYGAGQNFAERLLKQFNPSLSAKEARSKAVKMFDLTKGKRIYSLRKQFEENFYAEFPVQSFTKWQAFDVAKMYRKPVDEIFNNPKWVGGTESAMFNRLEEIANHSTPTTPFLNCRLSRALEPRSKSDEKFLPTRVNWVVQSGAVDFLHLMLVSMRWIMQDKARFCLSFHDEVRYLIPEKYTYQGALAMHVTNLLTRSFCSSKLGIQDLPQSVAFFSSVEIDTVLRKDANDDCKTPSNPHGLTKGYGIPHGESVDIYQAIAKAGGTNKTWHKMLRS